MGMGEEKDLEKRLFPAIVFFRDEMRTARNWRNVFIAAIFHRIEREIFSAVLDLGKYLVLDILEKI